VGKDGGQGGQGGRGDRDGQRGQDGKAPGDRAGDAPGGSAADAPSGNAGDAPSDRVAGAPPVRVGLIQKPHGVRGEVSVLPLTDDPGRFRLLREVILEWPGKPGMPGKPGGGAQALPGAGGEARAPAPSRPSPPRVAAVESMRFHKGAPLLKLAGVDDAGQAGALRGAYVAVPASEVRPLGEGAWYVFDLVGCAVYQAGGERLGELREVLETGSNDVYVVRDPARPGGDLLVPALRSVVKEVDVAAKRIVVDYAFPE
jgi:16S rRNA processing protein RimM